MQAAEKNYLSNYVKFQGDIFGVSVIIDKGIIICDGKEFSDPESVYEYIIKEYKVIAYDNQKALYSNIFDGLEIVDLLYYNAKLKIYGIKHFMPKPEPWQDLISDVPQDRIKAIEDEKKLEKLIKQRVRLEQQFRKKEVEIFELEKDIFKHAPVIKSNKKGVKK